MTMLQVHPEVLKAAQIAAALHATQVDAAGLPYFGHLERVAGLVQASGGDWVQVAAAYLHDSIEDQFDHDISKGLSFLLRSDVPSLVADGVVLMTKKKHGQTRLEYLAEIKNTYMEQVKLCDIHDNLSPPRMCYFDRTDQLRRRLGYANDLAFLAS